MKRQKSNILSKLPEKTLQPLLTLLNSKLPLLNVKSKGSEKNKFDKFAGLITHEFFHQTLGITDDKAILEDIAFWQWLNKKLAKLTQGRFPGNCNVRMGIKLTDVRKINFRYQYEYVCILYDKNLKKPYEYAEITTSYEMKYSILTRTKDMQKKNLHVMKALVEASGRPKGNDVKILRKEMREIFLKINSSPSNQDAFIGKSIDDCYRMIQYMRRHQRNIPVNVPVKQSKSNSNKKSGVVYIAENPGFANKSLLKIGETGNLVERVKQLSSTGVPEDYEILFCIWSDDCKKLEKEVHTKLKDCRYKKNKEFFNVEREKAIEIIMELQRGEI